METTLKNDKSKSHQFPKIPHIIALLPPLFDTMSKRPNPFDVEVQRGSRKRQSNHSKIENVTIDPDGDIVLILTKNKPKMEIKTEGGVEKDGEGSEEKLMVKMIVIIQDIGHSLQL